MEGDKTHIGSIPRVRLLKRPRNAHPTRVRAPATRNPHLGARDIKLRDARWPGVVDAQRLNTQQILSIGKTRRDVERVGPGKHPASTAASKRRAPVVDLEPAAATVVVRDRTGRPGHVQGDGTLVVYRRVEVEGERVASADRHGLGAGAVGTDVASQVG